MVDALLAARRRSAGSPAVLVLADELVTRPDLVSGFARHVGAEAALVVHAGSEAIAPDVLGALAEAGIGDDVDVTLLAPPPGSEAGSPGASTPS